MAKYKRQTVGSILKAKEAGKPDYLRLRGDMKETLLAAVAGMDVTKGLSLKLESKKAQLESAEGAIAAGKLSADVGAKVKERIEKIPDYVRFEVVLLQEEK